MNHLAHGDYLGPCTEGNTITSCGTADLKSKAGQLNKAIRNASLSGSGNIQLLNMPNPFNNTTKIYFNLSSAQKTSLSVYNNMGQLVIKLAEGTLNAGSHSYLFDGSNQTNGLYFYVLTTEHEVKTGRMMLQH